MSESAVSRNTRSSERTLSISNSKGIVNFFGSPLMESFRILRIAFFCKHLHFAHIAVCRFYERKNGVTIAVTPSSAPVQDKNSYLSLLSLEFSRLFDFSFPLSHGGHGKHLWRCFCLFFIKQTIVNYRLPFFGITVMLFEVGAEAFLSLSKTVMTTSQIPASSGIITALNVECPFFSLIRSSSASSPFTKTEVTSRETLIRTTTFVPTALSL